MSHSSQPNFEEQITQTQLGQPMPSNRYVDRVRHREQPVEESESSDASNPALIPPIHLLEQANPSLNRSSDGEDFLASLLAVRSRMDLSRCLIGYGRRLVSKLLLRVVLPYVGLSVSRLLLQQAVEGDTLLMPVHLWDESRQNQLQLMPHAIQKMLDDDRVWSTPSSRKSFEQFRVTDKRAAVLFTFEGCVYIWHRGFEWSRDRSTDTPSNMMMTAWMKTQGVSPDNGGNLWRLTALKSFRCDKNFEKLAAAIIEKYRAFNDVAELDRKTHSTVTISELQPVRNDGFPAGMSNQVTMSSQISGRPLSSMMIPKNVQIDLVDSLTKWSQSQADYIRKGIPWRQGYLIQGGAGTGKTTLIRTLGGHLNIPVYLAKLKNFTTNQSFYQAVRLLSEQLTQQNFGPKSAIILIEDADDVPFLRARSETYDALETGREQADSVDTLTGDSLDEYSTPHQPTKRKVFTPVFDAFGLDGFLNTVDGPIPMNGIVFVITTNKHNTHFDEAVTRPGRFGNVVEMNHVEHSEILPYLENMYEKPLVLPEGRKFPAMKGSVVEKAYLHNMEDPEKAINILLNS